MLRFGTTVIASLVTLMSLVMLIAGAHVGWAEGRPGAVVLGVLIATAIASVAALVSGVGGTLRRLEEAMARVEESMARGSDAS